MTTQAIQKGIEGGYKNELVEHWVVSGGSSGGEVEKFFLDPLFWQALGKALGWEKCPKTGKLNCKQCSKDVWLMEWHGFIDHIAKNKDPDEFFKELLI